MKFKKFMSLALALIMATALCVPALAARPTSSASADSSSTSQGGKMTGSTQVGKIDLVVYSPAGLVFNPSKIYVKVLTASGEISPVGNTDASTYKSVNDQVIVPTVQIQNKTNVPLNMTATVGIKLGANASGVQIATNAPADNATAKQVMVAADFAVTDANIYPTSGDAESIPDYAWLSASKLVAAAATDFNASTNKITGGKAHTAAQAVKIPATDATTTTNYVYVKFSGAATKAPTTPWDADDTFDLYTVYQFLPQTTPEKAHLVVTKAGTGTNVNAFSLVGYTSSDNGKPTYEVAYTKTAPTGFDKGSTQATNNFKDGTTGEYVTNNEVWPGFTVNIHPTQARDNNNALTGKYYALSAPTFYNEDGTVNNSVRATKVGTKSDAYYTFVMPEANVQCAIGVATQPT